MYCGKPVFPLNAQFVEIEKNAFSLLEKNNWASPETTGKKLAYYPICFFSFALAESQSKEVLKSENTAISVLEMVFKPELYGDFSKFEKQLSNTLPENIEFEFKKTELGDSEINSKILEKLSKENPNTVAKISNLSIAYFPVWNLKIKALDGVFSIDASGVDGKILNQASIPPREPALLENEAKFFSKLLSNDLFKILLIIIAALLLLTLLR